MKILVDKKILLEHIIPAADFASNKATIAVVEGILFRTKNDKEVEICGYDLEKGYRSVIGCVVEEQGCVSISAVKLVQVVKTMPDGIIEIKVDEKLKTTVTAGRSVMEMGAMSGEKYPDFPEFRGQFGFSIKQKDLRDVFTRTMFAMGVNNMRPELNGLFIKFENGILTAVSCDGNRLSVFERKITLSGSTDDMKFAVILPTKMIEMVNRYISESDKELRINFSLKHVMFMFDTFTVFTRIIDMNYIDYERFMPKAPKIFVELSADNFTSSLERAMLITEDRQQGQSKPAAICQFSQGILNVHAYSIIGKVNDEIPTEHDGDDIEIGFNCRFLYDAMKAVSTERVKLSLTTPLSGMTIEEIDGGEDRKFVMLILPVRLNK